MVYGRRVDITRLLNGAYKPTKNWKAPPCMAREGGMHVVNFIGCILAFKNPMLKCVVDGYSPNMPK